MKCLVVLWLTIVLGFATPLTAKCIKGDCFSGPGVAQTEDYFYAGVFNFGVYQGKGVLLLAGGVSYKGEFRNGTFHGNGIYVDQNRRIGYQGGWWHGQFQGYGELRDFDNSKYLGDWVDGVFQGDGKYIAPLNSCPTLDKDALRSLAESLNIRSCKYEGRWAHNLPNGRGKLTVYLSKKNNTKIADNLIYTGLWLEGKPRKGVWVSSHKNIQIANRLSFRWHNPAIERWYQ